MRLGIARDEADPWDFFNDVFVDLQNRYQTSLFKQRCFRLPVFHARINRYLLHHDLQTFMRFNDVVFFEWASTLLATATHLPKTCGIVTRLHRYEMYRWVDKINWSSVDKVILVSQAKQQEFIKRFPDQANKTVMLPVSVSLDKYNIQAKTFTGNIGILSHLTPRKRVYDLVLTFYECIQENPNLHLHIAGGQQIGYEDYYHALHHIVAALNLQDKVTFHGHVTNTCDWYHQIDIFVSNSYSEGLQVAPMEAMASGCYCLSHRWDGAEELLPEENLYYTDSELKQKILTYCEYPEAEKQRQRARMRAIACEKFDIRQSIADIRKVIEEVGTEVDPHIRELA
jgi:glycosyltransferase involved in cell wall biosynthesis